MKLPGDTHWSLGTCIRKLDNSSFEVEVSGRRYRRNRRHLRATNELSPPPNARVEELENRFSQAVEKEHNPSVQAKKPVAHEQDNVNQEDNSSCNAPRTPFTPSEAETTVRRSTRIYDVHRKGIKTITAINKFNSLIN